MYNYKNYENEKIYFYKPQFFFRDYKKINIKCNGSKKVILQTPKMRIPFNVSGKNICISFDEKTKYFYNFIEYLDKTIYKLINIKKNIWFDDLKYRPTISKYKNINFMSLNLPKHNGDYLFDIYDEQLGKINIDSLEKNNEIVLIIQLDYLWLNDNKIGCHWNVLQIKKYNSLNFNKCMIIDEIPTPPAPPPAPPLAPKINSENEKYLKMLKMGIPVLAVKNNMIRDGKDINIINKLPDDKENFILSLDKPIMTKQKKLVPSSKDLLNMKNVLKKAEPITNKNKKKKSSDGFAPSLDDIKNMKNTLKKIDRNIPKRVFNTRFGLAPTVDEIQFVINKLKKK